MSMLGPSTCEMVSCGLGMIRDQIYSLSQGVMVRISAILLVLMYEEGLLRKCDGC